MNLDAFTRSVARVLVGLDAPSPGDSPDSTLSLCDHHGVLPLLGYRLRQDKPTFDSLNGKQRKRIEAAERDTRLRNSLALSALKDALALLDQYWPERFLRNPGDLDLLVHPADFLAAKMVLLDSGWTEQPTVHGHLDDRIAAKYGFARVFRHPTRPVTIDLHREPVDRTEPFCLDPDELIESAVAEDLAEGIKVFVPGAAEHLCLVALHAVRHGSFRLQGFVDVYSMLELHSYRAYSAGITSSALCRSR